MPWRQTRNGRISLLAPNGDAPRVVEDVVELVDIVNLENIYLFEERARRITHTTIDDEAVGNGEPIVTNVLNISDMESDNNEHAIGFRFRLVFDDRGGNEFVADAQAIYGLPEKCDISQDIRKEFAERVAFFAVYPYLRASIQMSASRMGVPAPVLAIVRSGEFKLGDKLAEESGELLFNDNAPEKKSQDSN